MVTLGSRTSQGTEVTLELAELLGDARFMQRSFEWSRIFFFISLLIGSMAQGEGVTKVITNEEKIREEMVQISRELGVTCTECHNVQNFADATKKGFQIGAQHMKLTNLIKANGFDGKKGPLMTCYMCHRGKLIPDYKEPASNKPR
jgi:hypothetical protein